MERIRVLEQENAELLIKLQDANSKLAMRNPEDIVSQYKNEISLARMRLHKNSQVLKEVQV